MRGKPIEDVAELLPRLFNLCRGAQSAAVRLALGLPIPDQTKLAAEIRTEHQLRLAVMLPTRLGLKPLAVNAETLLGDQGFPGTVADFRSFMATGRGIAPLLAVVMSRFSPGEGCVSRLPLVWDGAILTRAALENSVAARHLDHPVMRHVETEWGRGPLWRLVARALDLQAAMAADIPAPRLVAPGFAVAPAARGLYALRATTDKGRVTSLQRITPTDHLLAPGGIMAQALASLPASKHDQAALLVDILDPCVPIELEGLPDA